MNFSFTERVRTVLAQAKEAADRLRHDYVGPEHMLMALLREGAGTGAAALRVLGVDEARLRSALRGGVRKGTAQTRRGELPYTSHAKKVLEHAMAEAKEMSHKYVGTEHLLLGLVREEQSIAAVVLQQQGVTLERARDAVQRVLASAGTVTQTQSKPVGRQRRNDDVWFLEIDQDSGTPIYEQIIARIEEAVATGQLERGERLPSVRELAAELRIAPGTVARAYSELESRGVVRSEGARGTRVTKRQRAVAQESGSAPWLERLLRRTVVAAFHRRATAQQVRDALERAMQGILKML